MSWTVNVGQEGRQAQLGLQVEPSIMRIGWAGLLIWRLWEKNLLLSSFCLLAEFFPFVIVGFKAPISS